MIRYTDADIYTLTCAIDVLAKLRQYNESSPITADYLTHAIGWLNTILLDMPAAEAERVEGLKRAMKEMKGVMR